MKYISNPAEDWGPACSKAREGYGQAPQLELETNGKQKSPEEMPLQEDPEV